MGIKIASLNLCLGLSNKKNIVKQLIIEEKIDILCLQETELINNLNHDLLSFPSYCFESEINDNKSRVGVYIHHNINYVRRSDLEGCNKHILIIDIKSKRDLRVITIYRPLNTPDGSQPRDFFSTQLNLIRHAITNNTILLGDFNLDWNKKNVHNYQFKHYL
jgi:exonuclease III